MAMGILNKPVWRLASTSCIIVIGDNKRGVVEGEGVVAVTNKFEAFALHAIATRARATRNRAPPISTTKPP